MKEVKKEEAHKVRVADHSYHLEALSVAGVSPTQDKDWINTVANVSADGPSGRVGEVLAHKIAAALLAKK